MGAANEVLVYFHGAFGFRRGVDQMEVYVPNIEAHVNLIGTWAGLYDLQRGYEYKLEGITGSTVRPVLNEEENVVFDKLSAPAPDDFFCKISLPFPQQIQPLCPEEVDPDTLFTRISSIAGGKIPRPSRLSHVQLYRFAADGTALRFVGQALATSAEAQGMVQQPVAFADEEGCGIFHLFSEPPHVFPTETDRQRVVHVAMSMAGMADMGNGTIDPALEAIRVYAPFTSHGHVALQDVLRMFPEARNVEVSVPDSVEAADSPPPGNLPEGIRAKDLRSLYHLYPHFEGGHPACNPGEAESGL